MNFPVYRKYKNNKAFFKINSYSEFEEITNWNNKLKHIKIIAKIHPDKVRIIDMIENKGNFWQVSSKEEWERLFSQVNHS